MQRRIILTVSLILVGCAVSALGDSVVESPYVEWTNGPSHDADFFPIAVWLQNPSNAGRYQAAGFNTYVGLWRGPTEKQLAELKKANEERQKQMKDRRAELFGQIDKDSDGSLTFVELLTRPRRARGGRRPSTTGGGGRGGERPAGERRGRGGQGGQQQ